MTPNKRNVILYIAMSLDGYIAQPNDDLSFLSLVQMEGEDYGYSSFIETVDTVILGRRTYDWVTAQVEYPHKDKTSYVITRTAQPSIDQLHFYSGELPALIHQLKQQTGKNIFCDGGAQVVNALLKHQLIDELIISIIPVIVGNGIKLFNDGRPHQELQLLSSKAYPSGLTQLHYTIKSTI